MEVRARADAITNADVKSAFFIIRLPNGFLILREFCPAQATLANANVFAHKRYKFTERQRKFQI
jgi:hypothetical protein